MTDLRLQFIGLHHWVRAHPILALPLVYLLGLPVLDPLAVFGSVDVDVSDHIKELLICVNVI